MEYVVASTLHFHSTLRSDFSGSAFDSDKVRADDRPRSFANFLRFYTRWRVARMADYQSGPKTPATPPPPTVSDTLNWPLGEVGGLLFNYRANNAANTSCRTGADGVVVSDDAAGDTG